MRYLTHAHTYELTHIHILYIAGYTKYSIEKYKNIHDTFSIFKNTYTHELYKCECKWKCNKR